MSDNLLAAIKDGAEKQLAAEAEVGACEQRLDDAKAALRYIKEDMLPELMETAETEDHTSNNGLRIRMKEKVRGSITKANEAEGYGWLEANGHGDLIKRQVIIEFNRDEEELAKEFINELRKGPLARKVQVKRTIPWQTLSSFCKEALENGVVLPDSISVMVQRYSTVDIVE